MVCTDLHLPHVFKDLVSILGNHADVPGLVLDLIRRTILFNVLAGGFYLVQNLLGEPWGIHDGDSDARFSFSLEELTSVGKSRVASGSIRVGNCVALVDLVKVLVFVIREVVGEQTGCRDRVVLLIVDVVDDRLGS